MKVIFLALLAAGMFIAGCITVVAQPNRHLLYTGEAIIPGWTEEKDLVAIRGEPVRKEKNPNGSVDYIYLEKPTGAGKKKPSREIIYSVDQEGTVTSIRSKGIFSALESKPGPLDNKEVEPGPGRPPGQDKLDQKGQGKTAAPGNRSKPGGGGNGS